jgi:DNA mismatch endonuclease, patch repair protein
MSLDPLNKEQRSERMSRIKSKNTKLEIIIRQFVFHSGYRYRLNVKELPGKPDLVFKSQRKVIFINGCFWHQHGCMHYTIPKTRLDYWLPKLQRNIERDNENIKLLEKMGWKILIIWECEIKHKITSVKEKISSFLMN